MKTILTLCILLAAFACNAQTEKKGDTLVIKDWQAYRFIKIGDKVYQINSPTITEVHPAFPNLIWKGNGITTTLTYDTTFLKGVQYLKGL